MKTFKYIAFAFLTITFLQCCDISTTENKPDSLTNKEDTTMEKPKTNIIEKTAGTPITNENLADVLEIQRIFSALTNACDSQQWDVIGHILVDDVKTTIGEEKGKSSIKNKEDIIVRWKGFFDSADKLIIHHMTSNERIFFEDANNATAYSKGVIIVENTPAGKYASEGGTLLMHRWINYELGVTRTDKGWKVNKVMVEYLVEEAESLKGTK